MYSFLVVPRRPPGLHTKVVQNQPLLGRSPQSDRTLRPLHWLQTLRPHTQMSLIWANNYSIRRIISLSWRMLIHRHIWCICRNTIKHDKHGNPYLNFIPNGVTRADPRWWLECIWRFELKCGFKCCLKFIGSMVFEGQYWAIWCSVMLCFMK